MSERKSLTIFLGSLLMIIGLTACGGNDTSVRPSIDREGYATTLPKEINTIVTLGPSNAEILVALGFGEKIIATDRFSADVEGLNPNAPRAFGIMDFDVEYMINLMPDIIFVTGMIRASGEDDPLAFVSATGITVIYIDTSESIEAIMEDVRFIASVMEAEEAGEYVISNMQAKIDEIRQIAETITEVRTVYFEISPAPWMWSTGAGSFLHEMIELVGAINIFEDHDGGFFSVSEEILIEANPDVILTSTNFLDNPISEIMERPGFDAITAVQNGAVFPIDTAASNRPSPNIVIALRQIAEAVFPEYFE